MTLNKAGFPGSVNDVSWSKLMDLLGNDGGIGMNVSAAAGDRTVSVSTGVRNVGGILADLDATQNVGPMPPNASLTHPKINRIILRARWSDKSLALTYREGTPGPSPIPPALVRDPGDQYEVSLAQVRLEPGHGALTSGDITRENTPPATGFYYITSIDQAPDPADRALIFYTPTQSLQVGNGTEYVEIATAGTSDNAFPDTGPANWTGTRRYMRRSGFVFIYIDLQRQNSTSPINVELGKLPAGNRPPRTWHGQLIAQSADKPVLVEVKTDGTVTATDLSVPPGERLRGSFPFPLD